MYILYNNEVIEISKLTLKKNRMNSIDRINKLSKIEFVETFSNIFEKSMWISEKLYAHKPFKNSAELALKMLNIFEISGEKNQLKIINSHPDLVIEKKLTPNSKKEQNLSGLGECSKEEFVEFKNLNIKYKKKFGFPFILSVKGRKKNEILNNFRQRISNNVDDEFNEAIMQVKTIANLRLDELNIK